MKKNTVLIFIVCVISVMKNTFAMEEQPKYAVSKIEVVDLVEKEKGLIT